jgi:tellurite resistance protein TehA-like permease
MQPKDAARRCPHCNQSVELGFSISSFLVWFVGLAVLSAIVGRIGSSDTAVSLPGIGFAAIIALFASAYLRKK